MRPGNTTMKVSRRQFLGATAKLGAGLGLGGQLWGLRSVSAAVAPSNRITVGCIGLGGKGTAHLRDLMKRDRVEVVALCDVDKGHLERALKTAKKPIPTYGDYREVLERDDIDAVLVATPDHWHCTIATHACRAGKDVYVEKPMMHNVAEGRILLDTARQYNRVVQLGTQQRSTSHFRHVIELIRNGQIGQVHRARCWFYPRGLDKWVPDSDPPPELDYDRWLGPAPWRPYNVNRVHYNFRNFWDYAGGSMSDWGVHLMDIVFWGTDDANPKTIEAWAKFKADAYFEMPEEMVVTYQFEKYQLQWLILHEHDWEGYEPGKRYGIVFYGDEGRLFVDRRGYRIYPGGRPEVRPGPNGFRLEPVKSHWDNFLDCMATRSRPVCDVEIGFHSSTTPILGNLAARLGRKLRWDVGRERFIDDPAADMLLSRTPRAPYYI